MKRLVNICTPYLTDDMGVLHPGYKKLLKELFYSYRKTHISLIHRAKAKDVSNMSKFEAFAHNNEERFIKFQNTVIGVSGINMCFHYERGDWNPLEDKTSSQLILYISDGDVLSQSRKRLEIKIDYNVFIIRIRVNGDESLIDKYAIIKAIDVCKNYHKKYRMLQELEK